MGENKLMRSAGILNILLGTVLFLDGILIAVMAFCCLLMSFSLFFMAAIPAFFVVGFLCIVTFIAAGVNIIAGTGALATMKKSRKISKIFSIILIVADVVVIPANIMALICGIYLLATEVNFLSVLIFIFATCAILLAGTSLLFSSIETAKRDKLGKV